MPLSEANLRDIAARGVRLDERLMGVVQSVGPLDSPILSEKLQRWGRSLGWVPFGLPEVAMRMGQANFNSRRLAVLLGPVCWSDGDLPDWVNALATLLDEVEANCKSLKFAESRGQEFDGRPERPFEHVLQPFVLAARRRLAEKVPPNCLAQLMPTALDDLSFHLLTQLTWLWAPALEIEFSIARANRGMTAMFEPGNGRQQYESFVRDMLGRGLAGFLREYAVLARLTVETIAQWVSSTAEFLVRMARDRARLAGELLPASAGQVARIVPGLSDPHDGSRCVMTLTFIDGSRLVYKPRDLAVDVAFAGLLDWLGRHGLALSLKVPRLVHCESYGWVEFIAAGSCPDDAAVTRFYRRAGQLMALLHVLGGTDCHSENLIAEGEHPVLVDCETVLHPQLVVPDAGNIAPTVLVAGLYDQTVLGIGLLPLWLLDPDGVGFDNSGLGHAADQDTPFHKVNWEHINTDRMVSRIVPLRTTTLANRPSLAGQPVALEAHVEALTDGFRAMSELLIAERDRLLAYDGPLAPLARASVRFLFRGSSYYGALLHKLREPAYLREGVDRSLVIERLAAGIVGPGALADGTFASILRDEQGTIEKCNVPRFAVSGNSRDLRLPDGTRLGGIFSMSADERARKTLSALDRGAVDLQINLIRSAVCCRQAEAFVVAATAKTASQPCPPATVPLATADALAAARTLGAAVAAHAILTDDGRRTWLGLDLRLSGQRLHLHPVGIGLYDGAAGIAFFLAALARFGGVDEAADMAQAALAGPRWALAAAAAGAELPAADQAIGLGGLIYALVYCADWLRQPDLLDEALAAVKLITPAHIESDHRFDLLYGVAGLMPGLLAVYRATKSPLSLTRALECGRHLLAHQRPGRSGGSSWPTAEETMLAGFSHGAAGIACQLIRLAKASGDIAFLAAAREAIAYEQTCFDPLAGNWRDLRASADGPPSFPNSWCHGAAGIVLARAACLSGLNAAELLPQIEAGLPAMLQTVVGEVDCLCCGNAGRIDILASLNELLARPALQVAAQQLAAVALEKATAADAWRFVPYLPRGMFQPTLFQGAAGIGYALLRLALPGRLPSVLLME